MRREIAGEVTRVDVKATDNARDAELYDAIVMSGLSLSPAFPAIHPLAVIVILARKEFRFGGIYEPRLIGEKVVGRIDDLCTKPGLLEAHPLMKGIFALVVQAFSSCKRK